MMIEFLLALMSESPLLFAVLLVNLAILGYIVYRISLYIIRKKKPGQLFSSFIWKLKVKRGKGDIETLEDAYGIIMETMKKEGLLSDDDKMGFRSRKKLIERMPDGKKREILETLFDLYEAKIYGKRRIKDEKNLVADIISKHDSL